MMHPNPFNDDLQESGIPMFGRNGTALNPEERAAIAKRRGLCLKCGTKTHIVKVLGRTQLTNDDVHQGICIKCNNHAVPAQILQGWQSRRAQVTPVHTNNRFKGAAHAIRYTQGVSRSAGMQRRPVPAPGSGSEAQPLQRKNSSNRSNHDSFNRQNSDNSRSLTGSQQRLRAISAAAPAGRSISAGGNQQASSQSQSRSMSARASASASSPQQGLEGEEYKSNPDEDIWTIMKALKDNREKAGVLRARLHSLRNLADDQAEAMYEIKDIMKRYPSDSRLITMAVGAIWGISSSGDSKKQEAADAGCLDAVIDVMRSGNTKDDPVAVSWALGAIASLAQLEANKKAIVDKGGLEILVNTLKNHGSHPSVFEWSCRALFSMLYTTEENPQRSFDRDIATIEDLDGVKVIVSVMKKHIPESVAQWWALKLLFRLQDRKEPPQNARVVRTMSDEDLANTCIQIIKSRTASVDVMTQCQEMLALLISSATNTVSQHKAMECIPVVITFLEQNQRNKALHETAARLLTSISRGTNEAKRQIADSNGIRPFVRIMSEAPDNLAFQQAGVALLWALSTDQTSFDYSILGEVKLSIEAAALRHPDDLDLNEAICGYIANVAALAQGSADTIPVNLVLRLSTPATGGVGVQASRVIESLFVSFPGVGDELVQAGLCDRLLEGLCDSNVDIQCSSSSALTGIATHSASARKQILDAGGIGTISAALFTTTAESLVDNLLLLVLSIVSAGDKKVLQLPNEIVQAILQAVTSFPNVTKTACTTIHNTMLVTVPGFKSVNTEGLVDLLLGVIDNRNSSDDLLIEASGTLWAYTTKEPLTNSAVASQIFRSILTLCSTHTGTGEGNPYNSPILTEAAGALAAVMHCIRDNPVHVLDNDIDLIISILDIVIEHDVDNVLLMDRLMDTIFTLCFLSKEVLIQFGVIVVVIDCMVEHEGNVLIQQKGCAILALLASTENLQVNLSIAETDGIDMIVSALAGFTDNVQIQTDACRALSHLSIDHESRMLISSQGGLMLLVNAMNKFRDDTDLLEAACSALLNLSSDAEEQVLASSSVVETVVATMRWQFNSPRLQEKSLGVLQNISMRSKDSKKAIAEIGGLGAVMFAIKEFMGTPSVLERAFTTLWSLAVLEDNQSLIANEGGINLVVNGMMANITFEKVQKQACGCLCTLSSNSENKTRIRDSGGVDAIVYAMWAHYSSDALLIEACRALSSLAVNVQTNEVMIASEGEISAIVSAMRRFPDSERLQEHACVTLRNFLLSVDNAAIMRPQAPELEKLMNAASARFPERCADRAKQVLASLR